MTLFITSDTHFGHKNILKFESCNKYRHDLYTDIDQMGDDIIKKWNSVVSPQDLTYHLGDVCLAYGKKMRPLLENVLSRLNGKIVLIKGNHDNKTTETVFKEFGHEVLDYHELDIEGTRVCMFHYPLGVWNKSHYGSVMLHGHSHGSYKAPGGRIIDVGWDVFGRVLPLKDVLDMAAKKEISSPDRH